MIPTTPCGSARGMRLPASVPIPRRSVLGALLRHLERKQSAGRGLAAEALGRLGSQAQESVPALILALEDPGEDVRGSAAWALGQIGAGVRDAVPALLAALEDPGIRWRV